MNERTAAARALVSDEARAQADREHQAWLDRHDPLALDYEIWQAEKYEREQERLVTRKAPGLIHKTREDALVQQQRTTQDQWHEWNAWVDGRINKAFAETLTDAIGIALSEVRKQLRDEIAELRAELRALRKLHGSQ
jgi:hypothetical protein